MIILAFVLWPTDDHFELQIPHVKSKVQKYVPHRVMGVLGDKRSMVKEVLGDERSTTVSLSHSKCSIKGSD